MLEATLRQNEKLIGAEATRSAGRQVPKMGGTQDNSTKGRKGQRMRARKG
jgi:hypothetical protein